MAELPRRRVCLVILDGWGYREDPTDNAIAQANTPTWDRLLATHPWTLLEASGLRVGLPVGQMGNSEVGHMNLGAGRVVMQDLVRIGSAIEGGAFFANPALVAACRQARETGATLHLVGLLGSGGVHALDRHLFALLDLATREGVPRVRVHGMLDGRDTPPTSGLAFLRETLDHIAAQGGRAALASLGGRYFGMDRDRRWQRVQKAYDAMVRGAGPVARDPLAMLQAAYAAGATDEFVEPHAIVDDAGVPLGAMRDGDVVICFNFRSDRMRQLCEAMAQPGFSDVDVQGRPTLHLTTMMEYDPAFPFPVAFASETLPHLVGEVISTHGRTQFRTAETEKYPHVTYFFNGGRELPFPGEDRQLAPSPKVATYDLQPEMSAGQVADGLVAAVASGTYDFLLCNFANGDMVGHTGVMAAAIRACETVDACLARVLDAAARTDTVVIVTADHGNADVMVDPVTHAPHTAHTTNPVPLVIVDPEGDAPLRSGGALCDVGPTALALMGLPIPPEMTGRSLRLAAVPA
ncbi:MAG: 2,3-bisphosphoglycerate-independent phosphoglycerate mutase [Gemmatimonadaceae bacterium]|nr:2,3-bisphosphoglycerate-independent phosphoglycerate mutase [Gemmatimonadaceae bacterium]